MHDARFARLGHRNVAHLVCASGRPGGTRSQWNHRRAETWEPSQCRSLMWKRSSASSRASAAMGNDPSFSKPGDHAKSDAVPDIHAAQVG
eukprot:4632657-Prymnesium_polylepis.1